MSNQSNIIRIACDVADPYRALVNAVTGGPVLLPRNRAARFELGVFDKGIWQETLTANYSSITIEIRPVSRIGAAEASQTVNAAAFANGPSVGGWNNRVEQHAVVDLDSGQTGLAMSGATERDLWLVITATKLAGGNTVTLAAGTIQMIEDGGQYSGAVPVAGNPTFYTAAQVDALLQAAMRDITLTANGYVIRPTVNDQGVLVWDLRPAP